MHCARFFLRDRPHTAATRKGFATWRRVSAEVAGENALRGCALAAGQALTQADLNRSGRFPAGDGSAAAIVDDVRERHDAAVTSTLPALRRRPKRLPRSAGTGGRRSRHGRTRVPLRLCAGRTVRSQRVHERQREELLVRDAPTAPSTGVKVTPALDSMAIYVPRSRACFPSTVLMDAAIPQGRRRARRVVMVTPPSTTARSLLYLGRGLRGWRRRVYAVGGARAIGTVTRHRVHPPHRQGRGSR